jgi:hypothetical protein
MTFDLEQYDKIKIDLQENVTNFYSFKVVRDYLSSALDVPLTQAAFVLSEYAGKFGDVSIQALHAAILSNVSQSDIIHDIASRNQTFFQPRTLDLWG